MNEANQCEVFVRGRAVVVARRRFVIVRPTSFLRRLAVSLADIIEPSMFVSREIRSIGERYADAAAASLAGSMTGINWNDVHADVWVEGLAREVRVLGVTINSDELEEAVCEADFPRAGVRVAVVGLGFDPWVAFGDDEGRIAVVACSATLRDDAVFDVPLVAMPRW